MLSWEQVPGDAGLHPPESRERPEEALEAVRHLIELGYVEPPDDDVRRTIERTLEQNRYNLALSLVDARQPTRAIAMLEPLLAGRPGHLGYNVALFEAYMTVGRHADARRVAEAMWAQGHRGPLVNLGLGAISIAERRADAALRHLRDAERANPRSTRVHLLIGRAFLRLHLWGDAARAFEQALKLDGDDEIAWEGLACATLGLGENAVAAEHALRAVALRGDFPEAHYHLGVALQRLGRPKDAEAALRRCVSIQPNLLAAHGRLLELYEGPLLDPTAARRTRQRAEQIRLDRRMHRRQARAPS